MSEAMKRLAGQAKLAERRLLQTLWDIGPMAVGPSLRALFGITRDDCKYCGGRGTFWHVPEKVQREAHVDVYGNRDGQRPTWPDEIL